jgi:hypothetical protein
MQSRLIEIRLQLSDPKLLCCLEETSMHYSVGRTDTEGPNTIKARPKWANC